MIQKPCSSGISLDIHFPSVYHALDDLSEEKYGPTGDSLWSMLERLSNSMKHGSRGSFSFSPQDPYKLMLTIALEKKKESDATGAAAAKGGSSEKKSTKKKAKMPASPVGSSFDSHVIDVKDFLHQSVQVVGSCVDVICRELESLECSFVYCEEGDWSAFEKTCLGPMPGAFPPSSFLQRKNRHGGTLLHSVARRSTPVFLSSFLSAFPPKDIMMQCIETRDRSGLTPTDIAHARGVEEFGEGQRILQEFILLNPLP